LELLACCIGAYLLAFVKRDIALEGAKEYFWTDSSTALHWIKKEEHWTAFFGNRVKEIRNITKVTEWRHVPGQENPEDLPSRGCVASRLTQTKWREGPSWLRLPEEDWPSAEPAVSEEEVNREKRKGVVTSLRCKGQWESWYFTYFSKYTIILRMIAWKPRFANNSCRGRPNRIVAELLVDKVVAAEKVLMRMVQKEVFSSNDVSGLKSLQVCEDKEGILRVRTKITEREGMENFKCPVLLLSNHQLVTLFIQEYHLRLLHAGLHTVLAELRENFWILKGRRTVRKVL
jgi:hypothetical protein